jgi:hypothetical protein
MHDIYNEEEVPNVKCMRVVEEEVSLSQLKTTAVPPEEEEVPVLKSPTIVVPPEAVVPLEEEEVLAPAVPVPQGPPYRGPAGGRGGPNLPCCSPVRGRGGPNPPCCGPAGRKGMRCPGRLLISIDFYCFRVLFIVRFSKLNYLLIADHCQLHAGKSKFLCHTSIFNNLYFNY